MDNATNRWLDKLAAADKAKGGTGSDYRLSQILGIERQWISKLRRDVTQMSDELAIQVAEELGIHPMVVIGEIRTERGRTEREKRFWAVAAKNARKGGTAAAVILAASLGIDLAAQNTSWGAETGSPARSETVGNAVYYVKFGSRRGRRYRRRKHRPSPSLPYFVPGRIRQLALAA